MRNLFPCTKWKYMAYSSLLILILSATIVNVFAAVSPYSPADEISIMPSTVTIPAIGQEVTVNLTITNINDCAGYDFWIYYNDTLLEMTGVNIDTDPANPGTSTQIAPDSGDRVDTDVSESGIVKYSVVWKFGVATYNGSGTAAQITFNGTAQGNSTLVFDTTWTKAYDTFGDDIVFTTHTPGLITVIPEFPVVIVMSLFIIATLATTILAKMVWSRKRRGPTIA